ncbi:MAG: hypothetical protein WBA74_19970, partial [Cyclobacteriaceae bacterium]
MQILRDFLPEKDQDTDLKSCLKHSIGHIGNESNWGSMDHKHVQQYLDWIYEYQLEHQKLKVTDLIYDELLSVK